MSYLPVHDSQKLSQYDCLNLIAMVRSETIVFYPLLHMGSLCERGSFMVLGALRGWLVSGLGILSKILRGSAGSNIWMLLCSGLE